MSDPVERRRGGPVERITLNLQDRVASWLEENAPIGLGDLRLAVTLESLQRTETADYWIIERKRLGRADVMELILDMVASGYSLPAILSLNGFPKSRTVMGWMKDYKAFREMFDVAGEMYAFVKAHEAEMILEGTGDEKADGKAAYRDKARSDLRMRLAENFNSKRFSKRSIADVNIHDDLASEEVISRFRALLISHAETIEAKTGVKITIPTLDAEIVQEAEVPEPDPMTLGMEGLENRPEDSNGPV